MAKIAKPPDALWRAMLRFLAAGICLTIAGALLQNEIVNRLLPLIRAWVDLVDPTFHTVDLSLVGEHADSIVQRIATPTYAHVVGTKVLYPGTIVSSQAAAGIVLQAPILAVALLLVWPWRSIAELGVRVLFGLALALCVLLLDVPMMLCGFAWYEELRAFDPDHFSLLVSWADSMNAGGRFVLAVVAAAAATSAAALLAPIHAARASTFSLA